MVMWTGEEVGGVGSLQYYQRHKVNKNMLILLMMNSKEKHVDSINDIKVNKNMSILSMT